MHATFYTIRSPSAALHTAYDCDLLLTSVCFYKRFEGKLLVPETQMTSAVSFLMFPQWCVTTFIHLNTVTICKRKKDYQRRWCCRPIPFYIGAPVLNSLRGDCGKSTALIPVICLSILILSLSLSPLLSLCLPLSLSRSLA